MVEVKLFDTLDAVAADAQGALDRQSQPRLFDRLEWYQRTVDHGGGVKTPLIARARNAQGSAWLFLDRKPRHAAALASWYTLDFGLAGSGDMTSSLDALAQSLKSLPHIALAPVGEAEPLVSAFRKAGWKVFVESKTENWYVHPPQDFDAYWASRPSRLRNTVKRKAKKAKLEIRIHRAFDEAAWADYRTIYAQSWKPEEGSWDFMRDFAEVEGKAGTLRLGIGYIDGDPIAAQLWTVENGQATIHKLAYTERSKNLSPGSILGEAMFRHVIEQDQPEIIDYGTGSEPYKADWMDEVRTLYAIDMYNVRKPAAWWPLVRRMISGLVRQRARG